MNQMNKIMPWVKPAVTTLLGLILLFRPDSLTTMLATIVGFVVSVIGAWLLISFFFGNQPKDGLRLAAGIIVMVLGFSIVRTPLSLISQLGRFIGILLVLQAARELTSGIAMRSKAMSAVTGIVGLVLMLVPMAPYRLLISGCGVVVTLVGIGMALDAWKSGKNSGGDPNIIDAG